MGRDVFISHATKDRDTANAVCRALEASGIRCWIAPRDVMPGSKYAAALMTAIEECRTLVLIFSAATNTSEYIQREVDAAVKYGKKIITFRIEDTPASRDLQFYLNSSHWLEATEPPLEARIVKLADSIAQDFGFTIQHFEHECDLYREALETAWADQTLTEGEIAYLEKKKRDLKLPAERAQALECAVLQRTLDAFYLEETQSAQGSAPPAWWQRLWAVPQYRMAMMIAILLVVGIALASAGGFIVWPQPAPTPSLASTTPNTPTPAGPIFAADVQKAVDAAHDAQVRAHQAEAAAQTAATRARQHLSGYGVSKGEGHSGGWTYAGEMDGEGAANGYGVIQWDNGQTFAGNWKKNEATGYGIYTSGDCIRYEGSVLRTKFSGYGVFRPCDPDGYRIGHWRGGKMNGHGARLDADGGIAEQGLYAADTLKTTLAP